MNQLALLFLLTALESCDWRKDEAFTSPMARCRSTRPQRNDCVADCGRVSGEQGTKKQVDMDHDKGRNCLPPGVHHFQDKGTANATQRELFRHIYIKDVELPTRKLEDARRLVRGAPADIHHGHEGHEGEEDAAEDPDGIERRVPGPQQRVEGHEAGGGGADGGAERGEEVEAPAGEVAADAELLAGPAGDADAGGDEGDGGEEDEDEVCGGPGEDEVDEEVAGEVAEASSDVFDGW